MMDRQVDAHGPAGRRPARHVPDRPAGRSNCGRSRSTWRDVVRSAVETRRPCARRAPGTAWTSPLPAGPVRLEADPTRLDQVFANLLHNARQVHRAGRDGVALSAEPARRDGGRPRPGHRDRHPAGAARPDLRHVHPGRPDPGPEQGRARARAGAGQGAGRDARRDGRGARATGRARAASSPSGSRWPPTPSRPAGRGRRRARPLARRPRILVVDDNRDAADSLRDAAASCTGTRSGWLTTGRPGWTRRPGSSARTSSCWTSGCPGMDGYEVARRMRQRAGRGRTPVVALTGYGRTEDRNGRPGRVQPTWSSRSTRGCCGRCWCSCRIRCLCSRGVLAGVGPQTGHGTEGHLARQAEEDAGQVPATLLAVGQAEHERPPGALPIHCKHHAGGGAR